MPPKKKVEQNRLEEYVDDTDMSVSSPLSTAPTEAYTPMYITAEVLQQILASNQQSMVASQRALQQERLAQQKELAETHEQERLAHEKALAQNEEKSRNALAESEEKNRRAHQKMLADNEVTMASIVASIPTPPVAPPKRVKVEVPKWREGEAPHEYFLKYEKAQTHNGIDRGQWGVLLPVFLSGAAQAAYSQIDTDMLEDYERVKGVMLKTLRDTPEQADRNWWSLVRKAGETMSSFYVRMRGVAMRRFHGCDTREALFEKVLLSRFLFLLPADQYNLVTMREPRSAEAVADIVDDLECRNEFSKHHLVGGNRQGQSGHSYYKRDYNQRGSHGYSNKGGGSYQGNTVNTDSTPSVGTNVQEPVVKGKVLVSSPTPPQAVNVNSNTNGNTNGNSANYRKKPIICYACKEPGHIKPNCPNRVRRLSPCEEEEDDNDDSAEPTWVDGWVGTHKITGMRYDSGCDRTVVDK